MKHLDCSSDGLFFVYNETFFTAVYNETCSIMKSEFLSNLPYRDVYTCQVQECKKGVF